MQSGIKRLLSLLIAFALLVPQGWFALRAEASADNSIVLQQSFEDGQPGGWEKLSWGDDGDVAVSAEAASDGSKSLKFSNRASRNSSLSHDMLGLLQSDHLYDISFKVRSGLGSDTFHLASKVVSGGTTSYPWLIGNKTVNDTAWTTFELQGYQVPSHTTEFRVWLESDTASTSKADVYLDEVLIKDVTPPTGTPSVIVLNQSFEDNIGGGWEKLSWGDDGDVAVSAEAASDGSKSLKFSNRASRNSSLSHDMLGLLQSDHLYDISFKVRSGLGSDTFHLASKVVSGGTTSYPWLIGNKTVNDTAWTTFELQGYQVPSDTTEFRVWLESDSASTSKADVYLDEMLITDLTPDNGGGDQGDLDQSGVTSDFEDGIQGWIPRNDGDTVTASTADNYTANGSQSLLATAGSQYAGPLLNVLGKMHRNYQYDLSVWVKMAQGQAATSLRLSLQYGSSSYANVSANTTVTDSAWVKLSGRYTMTQTPTVLNAYIETATDNGGSRSFYIDDFELSYIGPVDNSSLPLPVQTDIPSMKDVYADDFTIGAAVTPDQLTGETAELLKKHYNSLVAENAMKWDAIEPTEGQFNFTGADAIRQFAVDNGMKMRGHTLLWHSQVPDWVFEHADENKTALTNSPADQQILLDRLENHIKAVVEHFGTDVQTYDVVNEVIDPSEPDGFRRSKWYEILGPSYIDKAFEFAHKYAPAGTKLVINDYSTTDPGKRKFLYDLVKGMKERGVPVDAVGHQMHINIKLPTADEIKQTFEMFASLGVTNQVTELDISVYTGAGNYSSLPEDVDIELGHRYADVFDAFKASKDILTGVTIWGIADDHTWLSGQNEHTKDFPLPFDSRMQAKQAYWGIVDPSKLKVMTRYQSVAQGTPVIDGTSELVWNTVSPVSIAATGNRALSAKVKPLWDENHLYVYVDVTDPTSSASDQIDLYVDGNNGKTATYEEDDVHYTLKRTHSDVEDVTYSVVERSGGYVIEAALPLDSAAVDQQIGFDLTAADGGNDSPHTIAWNDTTFTQASDTSKYGVFQFINSSKTTETIQGTPVIDGNADAIWSKANEITTDVWVMGSSGATAKAKTMWDAGHLYVYAVVTDNLLSKASTNAYEEDSVEIFVDPNNNKSSSYESDDGQYRVNFDNERSGGGSTDTSAFHTVTRRVSGGYVVEAAIDIDPSFTVKDNLLGFDLQVNNDQDGSGARSSVAMWNDPTGSSWQNTSRFGVARLVDSPPAENQTGGSAFIDVTNGQTKVIDGKITPSVTSSEGHATAVVTSDSLNQALGQAPADATGKKQAVIELAAQSGVESYGVQLPVQNLSASESFDIKVKSELGEILLPSKMLANTDLGTSESVTVRISSMQKDGLNQEVAAQIGNHPIVNLEILNGDKVIAWNNPTAPVTVSVPYTPTADELSNPDSIVVWYIAGDGSVTAIPNGRYDAATGTVVFQTTHFSTYAVASGVKSFGDIASVPWAKQAIEAMAARDIIKGTSAGSFSPAVSIKRADFIVLLVRALELNGSGKEVAVTFSDVNQNAYYYNELAIAKELGIAAGFGDNSFKPDSSITRQDMMVLTTRALAAASKQVAAGGSLDAYADASGISAYAKESAAALVKSGIVIGNSGKLAPNGLLTRAEAAVVLYRIWKL